ncbi:hypothetical protein ACX9MO_05510 [Pseudooceanicola sp. 502str34]
MIDAHQFGHVVDVTEDGVGGENVRVGLVEEGPDQVQAADTATFVDALGDDVGAVPTTTWNDAFIFGDIYSEEAQQVLTSELVTGFSDRAPKVAGDKWLQKKVRVRDLLEALTRQTL